MKKTLTILLGGALLAAGCAGTTGTTEMTGTASRISLPAKAMPRAGECRFWFPNKPFEQPPSGPCAKLADQIPPGTWFLRRPSEAPNTVVLAVTNKKGTVMSVHTLDAASGQEIVPAK